MLDNNGLLFKNPSFEFGFCGALYTKNEYFPTHMKTDINKKINITIFFALLRGCLLCFHSTDQCVNAVWGNEIANGDICNVLRIFCQMDSLLSNCYKS